MASSAGPVHHEAPQDSFTPAGEEHTHFMLCQHSIAAHLKVSLWIFTLHCTESWQHLVDVNSYFLPNTMPGVSTEARIHGKLLAVVREHVTVCFVHVEMPIKLLPNVTLKGILFLSLYAQVMTSFCQTLMTPQMGAILHHSLTV